jgi:hypothetical protein
VILDGVDVECYGGYKAHERPTAFTFQGRRLEVTDIIDHWYEGSPRSAGPSLDYFKVCTREGEVFILRYNALFDAWAMVLPVGQTGEVRKE